MYLYRQFHLNKVSVYSMSLVPVYYLSLSITYDQPWNCFVVDSCVSYVMSILLIDSSSIFITIDEMHVWIISFDDYPI